MQSVIEMIIEYHTNAKTEIERMLKLKIIQPSQSEWGSPCILVRKPPEKGKLQPPRFVVDYHRLNSVTQGDGYPLPSISKVETHRTIIRRNRVRSA